MKRCLLVAVAATLFSVLFVSIAYAAPTVCQIGNGCTGTSTAPAYGQLLIGGKNGEYEYAASSTFGGGGSAFSTTSAAYWLTQQTTSNLSEGSNLYYTLTRWASAFAGTTTDALAEGANHLYFTSARAITALTGQNVSLFNNDAGYLTPTAFNTDFDTRLTATTSLPKITTLAGLSLPYSQLSGVPDLTQYLRLSDWYATTTDQLKEGTTNLYFTNARADARFVADLAATTSVKSITTLSSLSLPASQVSGISGTYPITYSGGTISTVATSSLGLTIASFASHNVSQWTNDAGYITSLSGAASSTLLGDSNTFTGTDKFTNAASDFGGTWQTFSPSHFLSSNAGDWAGTWQTFSPSHFQVAGNYLTANAIATSTGETAGQLAYWTSTNGTPATLGKVATSTLTASSPLTGSFTQIGSSGSLGCQTASGLQAGCLSSSDWTTFNNKQVALTFSWPLVNSANIVSFNATTTPWAINQFVYINAAGLLVSAASSSLDLPNGALQNSSITVNGTAFNLGDSHTITAASSTLLANNNTFSGNDAFSNTISGSITGNANTATTLQNTRTINGVSFNGSANIVIASTTLLGDHNTFSASTTFQAQANLQNASSSVFSAGTICIGSDVCRTTWPTTANAASSTLLGDNNTFSGVNKFTNASSDFSGTWQTFSPSHFQVAGTYLTALGNYATTTGTAISISTSTETTNGVTLGMTAAVSANGILLTPTISGTLSNAGLQNSTIGATSPNSTLTFGSAASLGSTFTGDINLATGNVWTPASTTFTGHLALNTASSTLFTAGTEWIPSLGTSAGTFLAVDPNGKIIATSTPAVGGSGTVTSIATNNGITGGAITTTGTLSLDTSYGAVWTPASTTFTGHLALNTASTTQLTAPTIWTGLTAYNVLTTDAAGKIVASSTIGNSLLVNGGSETVNTTSPLGGGGSVVPGGSLTLTCATCLTGNQTITLSGDVTGSGATAITTAFNLANSHWWTARQNLTNASTSEFTATSTVWFTGIAASRPLYVDANGLLGSAGSGTSGNCVQWGANNTLADAGAACGTSGGGAWPFTPSSYNGVANQSTTTPFWLNGAQLIASSTLAANATTTSLYVTGVKSAILLDDSNGQTAAYGGTTCTNQFVRSLNGSGVATCNTVANADLAHSTIVVNSTTLTLGDTNDTITAASSTLLVDNNTFSGSNIFSQPLALTSSSGTTTIASGQGFTVGGSQFIVQQGSGNIEIGTTSSPNFLTIQKNAIAPILLYRPLSGNTVDMEFENNTAQLFVGMDGNGNFGVKSTDGSLGTSPLLKLDTTGSLTLASPLAIGSGGTGSSNLGTGVVEAASGVLSAANPTRSFVIGVASTTALTGTTTSPQFSIPFGLTVTSWSCTIAPAGATAEVEWQYANPTAYTTVTPTYLAASTTPGNVAISTNNTPAAQATSTLSVGNPSGSPLSGYCTFVGNSATI